MAKTYRPYVPEQDLLLPPSLRDSGCRKGIWRIS
jgi:hypothetical protein